MVSNQLLFARKNRERTIANLARHICIRLSRSHRTLTGAAFDFLTAHGGHIPGGSDVHEHGKYTVGHPRRWPSVEEFIKGSNQIKRDE
jgi:hypothetical protein